MDTYNDYLKYIKENEMLIKTIKQCNQSTYIIIEDLIDVLDYISNEKLKKTKLDSELLDLFDFGYDYLSTFIVDFEYIYNDYFQQNDDLLIKYDQLISYWFFLQDFLVYLQVETKQSVTKINKLLDKIDIILKEKKEIPVDLFEQIEELTNILDPKANYKPVFSVYSLVKEELNI